MTNEELRKLVEGLRNNGKGCSCAAYSRSECACDAVWAEDVASQAADALSAIIEAAGDEDPIALIQAAKRSPVTADGVRVTPGAIVYIDLSNTPRWEIFGVVACTIEGWDTRTEAAVFRNTPTGNKPGETEEIFFGIEDCYSSPEAAEAAREREGE